MAEEKKFNKKRFIDLDNKGAFNGLNDVRGNFDPSYTPNVIAQLGSLAGANPAAVEAAKYFQSKGLGDLSVAQIKQIASNPDAVQKYGIGKTFSYFDLAQEALKADPNFDPEDKDSVVSFAEEIKARGLTNENREDIRSLATSQSVNRQIERATNPGKFLDEQQIAANRSTAERLAQQYGQNNPDLVDFLAERIAEGETAFELGGFLQTTPQYLKAQSDAENLRVQQESAAARESLNEELLKGEDEAFKRAVPQIISSYMRAGRLGSSGVDAAVAKERARLAQERQGFLANAAYSDSVRSQGYRREDFVGSNAQAFNQYLRQSEPSYQQRFNVQNAANFSRFQAPYEQLNRFYSLQDQARARQYQLDDYAMQRSDYDRYLSQARSGNREAAMYGLFGNLLGTAGAFGMKKFFD